MAPERQECGIPGCPYGMDRMLPRIQDQLDAIAEAINRVSERLARLETHAELRAEAVVELTKRVNRLEKDVTVNKTRLGLLAGGAGAGAAGLVALLKNLLGS